MPDDRDRGVHGRRAHALVVGVSRYPNLGERSQLVGCVNDARLMHEVLGGRFGFREQDMSLLLDEGATRAAITAGLATVRAAARQGDLVVFYYSGHGSQVRALDGDEADGRDETIVPYDGGRCADAAPDITDDEIYRWLLAVSTVTTNITVIADTCFSGNLARGGPAPREKWIEPDLRRRARPAAARSARRPLRPPARAALHAGPSGFLPLDERYVLLAACRSDQHAKELKAERYGAFTFHLSRELLRAPADATYREVVERVRLAMAAAVTGQTPQVEGARDRVLFGEARRCPLLFLPVLECHGPRVVLGGGAVHGVGPGSVWAVHPPGTREPTAPPRGLVRVDAVRSVRCEGASVEEREPIAVGDRAFEHARAPGGQRLAVGLPAAGPARRLGGLAAALRRSRLLRPAGPGEAAPVRIALALPTPTEPAPGEPRGDASGPPLRVAEPSWVVLSPDDELLQPPLPRARPGAVAALVGGLEDLARARNLLAIECDDPESAALAETLSVELFRRRGSGPYEHATAEAGGDVVFLEGDRLALRVLHRADLPLYLHVLDVGVEGSVTSLYPVRGASDALVAGVPLHIGTRPGQNLVVRLPEALAARAAAAGQVTVEGREALKIFATTAETDLSGWGEAHRRTARAGDRGPVPGRLAAVLAQALGTRAARHGRPATGDDRWTVRTLDFLVASAPRPAPCPESRSALNNPRDPVSG